MERSLEVMLRAGVPAAEIARRIGVDRSAVTHWKNGNAVPTPEHRARLQDVLDEISREVTIGLFSLIADDDERRAVAAALREA